MATEGVLRTLTGYLTKLRTVNTTATSFGSRIPTVTKPSGIGDAAADTTSAVFDVVDTPERQSIPSEKNRVKIVPFGAGADTTTFSMRVIGWHQGFDRADGRMGDANDVLWIPLILAEFSCALSATPIGIAGRAAINTDLFCDTITSVTGNAGVDQNIISPTGDVIGHVVVDMKGSQILEITFDMTGATSANAFVGWY